MWGQTGITRLFDSAQGGQIGWLIPATLVLLLAGLLLRGTATRTDPQRAALILWGGWLLVTGLIFSFMQGIFHSYYTVALAPAVAALTGAGAVQLWRQREKLWVRATLALTVGLTTATSWLLLSRAESFVPWLRWVVLAGGIAATLAMFLPASRKSLVAAIAAILVALAGPTAYTVDTIATAHSGSIPSAGPSTGGFGMGGPRPGDGEQRFPDGAPGAPAADGAPAGTGRNGDDARRGGGFLDASTPSTQVTALLSANGDSYTWAAAAVGAQSAAGFQLATELPVMPIGGFNGSDPSPTLEQFQQYVAEGRIHYFIGGGNGPGHSGDSHSAEITKWVEENFTAQEIDGVTLYDLTS